MNIQVSGIITQKAEKVRMGKGKGGYKGLIASVGSGVKVISFSTLRKGLLTKLSRWLSVRTNFLIRSSSDSKAPAGEVGLVGDVNWCTSKLTQKRYLYEKFLEFQEQLTNLRQPALWIFFQTTYYWRFVVPYAI
jgi:hypothetical protein